MATIRPVNRSVKATAFSLCPQARVRQHRSMTCMAASSQDLLVVGPGVLGSYLGKLWKDKYSDCRVVGQTNTTGGHARLQEMGLEPRTNADADASKFPFVAICAPPSGSTDYPATVAAAADLWDGTGSLVFTSSAGIYAVQSGPCTEESPVQEAGTSERIDKLLGAENAVLAAGGNVVRLVGLYHATRGGHSAFLKMGELARNGENVINVIHYEDAASLCLAVLEGNGSSEFYRGQVFLGTDGVPMTYREMMDICEASDAYEGSVQFTGTDQPSGKTAINTETQSRLGWHPKYPSFKAFVQEFNAKDFYNP